MLNSSANDSRVSKVLDEIGYRYDIDDDGDYKLVIKFEDGRSQVGFIESRTSSYGSLEIRDVYSIAYIFDDAPTAKISNLLLSDNNAVKLGAWRIKKGKNNRHAIVFAAQVGANCDARTMKSVVSFVWGRADNFEEEYFSTDEY